MVYENATTLEKRINEILNLRKEIDKKFKLIETGDDFLNSSELDDLNEYDPNSQMYSNNEEELRNLYLNKILKKDIIRYRENLIKFPGSFEELGLSINYFQNGKELFSRIKPILLPNFNQSYFNNAETFNIDTFNSNDYLYEIKTGNIINLDYEEIKNRIILTPVNLIGIVNMKFTEVNKTRNYSGLPIIYNKKH